MIQNFQILGIWDFLCRIAKARAKRNLSEFAIFRNCGLGVPNMLITKAIAKESLGELICLSITKSENKSPDLRFRGPGTTVKAANMPKSA